VFGEMGHTSIRMMTDVYDSFIDPVLMVETRAHRAPWEHLRTEHSEGQFQRTGSDSENEQAYFNA
jgi:hypothetical protein